MEDPRFVGLSTVPADVYEEGYDHFTLRADLEESYLAMLIRAWVLGAIVTSSGAIRALDAGVGPGRSTTSLHYTGRALDLFVRTGMTAESDRYAIVPDGGTEERPQWKVYCLSEGADTSDPLYDPALVRDEELECAIWRPNRRYDTHRRRGLWVCLTDVMAEHGWRPIPSRPDWRDNYLSVEWWHFEHHHALADGRSRFGDELARVWPASIVQASGLPLGAIWNGGYFDVPDWC